GNRLDYDHGAQSGATGWSYRGVLPYFKRSEDNETLDDDYHAKGGPLGVARPRAMLPICEAFFTAAEALGIPFNADFNGKTQEGVGFYQLTQRNVRRSSAVDAFLKPALARRNLSLASNVLVDRIGLERDRAVGVAYVEKGAPTLVRAKR